MSDPTPINEQPVLATTVPLDQAVEHLTTPQRAALTAIIEGRTVTAAAKEAGVHRATIHRWLKSNPVFRAAYNAWEHESKTNTMSRLLAIVKKALDAVTWSIDEGDGRLAYTLLKDLGLLTRIQDSLTDPKLLNRQMQLDHSKLLRSLDLLMLDNDHLHHETPPHPPHRAPAD